MTRSLWAMLLGTFVLRVSTAITGTMLVFYLAHLNRTGVGRITSGELAVLDGGFYITELAGAIAFGVLADRFGRKAVMLLGPIFGAVAVFLTGLTTRVPLLFVTRLLEGASTAASVPSTLGFIAAETADDEVLRGRVVALFELVTLGGLLAIGPFVGGVLFDRIGPPAFFLNCAIYLVALACYVYGVVELRLPAEVQGAASTGPTSASPATGVASSGLRSWGHYRRLFFDRKVLLFAPTWIAVNAIIGLWRSQAPFLLTGESTFRDPNQLLLRGFTPTQIGAGMAVLALFFGAGILFWGNAFGRFRRTTILLFGLVAFGVATVVVLLINHAFGVPPILIGILLLVLVAALFVLAGATPAAVGLLADVSEGFHEDRSTIMGLYSVFLGLGQVIGIALAGLGASVGGVDGLVVATGFLIAIGMVALLNLRASEHQLPSITAPVSVLSVLGGPRGPAAREPTEPASHPGARPTPAGGPAPAERPTPADRPGEG
ncbi:MAG: MFS transporter [Candidatus Limnocylindrales bacterium]